VASTADTWNMVVVADDDDDDPGMKRHWQTLGVHSSWKFGGRQRSAPASMHLL